MEGKSETPKSFSEINREKLIGLSRKIMLAGLGAAVLAQDEMKQFFELLVERGELAEKDAREMMREILERRDQMMRERKSAASPQPSAATKADIEALTAKINELNKKIEELKKQKAA